MEPIKVYFVGVLCFLLGWCLKGLILAKIFQDLTQKSQERNNSGNQSN